MRVRIASISLLATVAAAMVAAPVHAAPVPVDLREWAPAGEVDAGVWEVSGDGSQVVQTINDEPTFFLAPDDLEPGTIVNGTFLVTDTSDDDYVGFVFGVRSPLDQGEDPYDLFVFDWKAVDQTAACGDGTAHAGFSLMRVQGGDDFTQDWQATDHPVYWCHDPADPRVDILGTQFGTDQGWVHNTEYVFTLEYSLTHVTIRIDGAVIFDVDGNFPVGRFGFYNYSQAGSTYNGFTEEPVENPPPIRIDEPTGDVKRVADLICQYLHTADSAREVVLARDDVFADTLVGAPLAEDDGCILFTPGGPDAPLDPMTRAEIDRALPEGAPISILGGTNAVSQAAEDELRAAGYDVNRRGGETRIETAVIIGETLLGRYENSRMIGLAYADNWPDAVTGGAWASENHVPILLTYTDPLHPATAQFISDWGITNTMVLGGQAVISDATAASTPSPFRVFGVNRMATAAQIADELWGNRDNFTLPGLTAVNLELPNAWALALAASPLSSRYDAPQVGVESDRLPVETEDYLNSLTYAVAPDVYVIGSEEIIEDSIAQAVADAAAA